MKPAEPLLNACFFLVLCCGLGADRGWTEAWSNALLVSAILAATVSHHKPDWISR